MKFSTSPRDIAILAYERVRSALAMLLNRRKKFQFRAVSLYPRRSSLGSPRVNERKLALLAMRICIGTAPPVGEIHIDFNSIVVLDLYYFFDEWWRGYFSY